MLFVLLLATGTIYDIIFIQKRPRPLSTSVNGEGGPGEEITSVIIHPQLDESAPLLHPQNKQDAVQTEPSMFCD